MCKQKTKGKIILLANFNQLSLKREIKCVHVSWGNTRQCILQNFV